MKILMMYEYPPSSGELATQGDLLFRGLREMDVDVQAVHFESAQEKEWYYRWFKPDVAVGVGDWEQTPDLILHPERYGIQPVPWLTADGLVADHQEILNTLPLICVTSSWIKDVYRRDGVDAAQLEVLPGGCDTNSFIPRDITDKKVLAVRAALGVRADEIMILTVGEDTASKGIQEVMQALALIDKDVPPWRYVCKVWPQPSALQKNLIDLQLATRLGIDEKVVYTTNVVSRNLMPYLIAACDIYAGPSRLESFGIPHLEAGACEKPVVGIRAMGMLDTLVHGKTAFLADIAHEVYFRTTTIESGESTTKLLVNMGLSPRIVVYQPAVQDIAEYLLHLMQDKALRKKMGRAGRKRVVTLYGYRAVAKRFVQLISKHLAID